MKQVWVKSAGLCGDRADDARGGGAHGGHGDAGAEVDQGVAVDVLDDAAVGPGGVHGEGGADTGGDDGRAARGERLRLRAGQRGAQLSTLRQGGVGHDGTPVR